MRFFKRQIRNNFFSRAKSNMDFFSLPTELVVGTTLNWTDDELNNFCERTSKETQQFCTNHIYRDAYLKERYGTADNKYLPYIPETQYEKFLWFQAIFGSSLLSADLVHADYACMQALKLGNENVYKKYIHKTSLTSRAILLRFELQAGYYDNFFYDLSLDPRSIGYLFDLPEDQLLTILSDRGDKFIPRFEGYPSILNERLVSNLVKHGRKYAFEDVYNVLKTIDGVSPYNYPQDIPRRLVINYAYMEGNFKYVEDFVTNSEDVTNLVANVFNPEYITVKIFRMLLEKVKDKNVFIEDIVAWNRWDLYHILNDRPVSREINVDGIRGVDMNSTVFEGLSYLSQVGTEIMYKLNPKVFEESVDGALGGYYSLVEFCNRNSLVPPMGVIAGDIDMVELILKNPPYKKPFKVNLVKKINELFPWKVANPLHGQIVDVLDDYHLIGSSYGKLVQTFAWFTVDSNVHKIFYGHNILDDETPLAQLVHSTSVIKLSTVAKEYGTNIAFLHHFDKIGSITEDQAKLLGREFEQARKFSRGNSILSKQLSDKKLFSKYKDTAPVVLIKTGLPILINKVAQNIKKLTVEQADYLIPFLFDNAPKPSIVKKVLQLFPRSSLSKAVPALISKSMFRNNDGSCLTWITPYIKDAELDLEYFVIFYNCICPVGVSFLLTVFSPFKVKTLLNGMLNDWRVPNSTKEYIRQLVT